MGNFSSVKSETQISNVLNRHKTQEGELSISMEVSPLVLEDKQRIKTQRKLTEIKGGRGVRSHSFELPYPQLLYF